MEKSVVVSLNHGHLYLLLGVAMAVGACSGRGSVCLFFIQKGRESPVTKHRITDGRDMMGEGGGRPAPPPRGLWKGQSTDMGSGDQGGQSTPTATGL